MNYKKVYSAWTLASGVIAGIFVITLLYVLNNHETQPVVTVENNIYQSGTPQSTVSPTPTPTILLNTLPTSKTLPGGIQVFQTFNNCGPAALSMALSHYKISISQQELGLALRPFQHPTGNNDDKSVTLTELAKKGETYGFITYHRPAGNMEKVQQFIAYDIPVIARTLLHLDDDIGHYRVIKGYDKVQQVIIQDDSLQGANLAYSYEEFNKLWETFNFEYLVLVPHDMKEIAEAILADHLDEKIAWQDALTNANTMLMNNPDNRYAEFNRSVALYELGRYEESVVSFEKVEQRLPFRTLWYQIKPILAYYKLGRYERVLAMVDQILNRYNRAYSELYYLRGLIYQKQGNEKTAQEQFTIAGQYNTTESYKENIDM